MSWTCFGCAIVGAVVTVLVIFGLLLLFGGLEKHASIEPDERDRDYT